MFNICSIGSLLKPILSKNKGRRASKSAVRSALEKKITTPEDAVSCIKSGDRVFIGTGCAAPRTLVSALENLEKKLNDVLVYHVMADGAIPFTNGSPKTKFYHKAFFVDRAMQEVIKQGKGDYIPMSLAQVPSLLKNGGLTFDVALVQVTCPDKNGFISLGVSADITHAAVQNARVVIAELNSNMPRTHGNTAMSIDNLDRAVVVHTPVSEYLYPDLPHALAKPIARYVASIVDDGSTLQIGLGKIPNTVVKYLTQRRNLGIHSDVITDALVELIDLGVVNGQQKTLHPGQIVASYCLGTRRLYDLIDNNPLFCFQPLEYVCDPSVLRANNKLVSITQARAVDLTGQVCSDQFEGQLLGGVSAQPDFIRGAASSPGGKPILCLTSTTQDGKQSKIRPRLREGEGVAIPRSDVHYVVTECGIAYLFGKSISERALALIEVAHPSFRSWLLEEAKRLGYVRADQNLKCKTDGTRHCFYPQSEERVFLLKDDTQVVVRPSKASDARKLQDLFYKLPPEDVYTRFFRSLKSLPVTEAEYFCNVDYDNEMAFVAAIGQREQETIIGSAFYVKDQATNTAEVAYMILHEWHGKGLGTILQARMAQYAKLKGLEGFRADILPENRAMLQLARKCGIYKSRLSHGVYEVSMFF
jgi:acyl-CoA hydrolase/RimJ/RimL family protein N-acetyltransferase